VLAAASLAVQALFGDGLPWESVTEPSGDPDPPAGNGNGNGNGAGGNGGDAMGTPDEPGITGTESEATPVPEATPTPEETPTPVPDATPTPESVETAAEAAAGVPPGLLFFAGGVFALAVIAAALWVCQ
jgi:hypothetical protein